MNVSAIIVAAGLSTRMGAENKLLLPFKGKELFLHIVDAALESEVYEVIVVTGHEAESIKAAIGHRKVRMVHNPNYEKGLTSSIQTGVKAANKTSDGYLICLSDMPFIRKEHLNRIIDTFVATANIIIPYFQNKRTHPILLGNAYKKEILEHPIPTGCKAIIKTHSKNIVQIIFEEDFSQDVDDPQTYQQLNEGNT